jgi:hypothetical protein
VPSWLIHVVDIIPRGAIARSRHRADDAIVDVIRTAASRIAEAVGV